MSLQLKSKTWIILLSLVLLLGVSILNIEKDVVLREAFTRNTSRLSPQDRRQAVPLLATTEEAMQWTQTFDSTQASASDNEGKIVYSDDFEDGIIDLTKWRVSGDGITEANGVLCIFRDTANDSIRPVDSFTGDFEIELSIKLEQINWQDMFHGISLSDSKGFGISFGFSQYGKFYQVIYTPRGASADYGSFFDNELWYQWKLAKVGEHVYIYVDGELEFSSGITHIKGDIFISLPGFYEDGNGGEGTKSCIDYFTVIYKEIVSPETQFNNDKAIQWMQTYGGREWEVAYSGIQTIDGGFVIVGCITKNYWTFDEDTYALMVKTDSHGVLLWNRTFGGLGITKGYSVIQTMDGGYAIAGCTKSPAMSELDAWLVKTNAKGNTQWIRTYGSIEWDAATEVIETNDGGFALVGSTFGYAAERSDFWLVKTNSMGKVEWTQTYGGSGDDRAESVIQTSDGGFALAGVKDGDAWLVKVDSEGNEQWNLSYRLFYDYSRADVVIQTIDGEFTLGGYTYTRFTKVEGWEAWLAKIDAHGEQQWAQTYGGLVWETPQFPEASVIQTTDRGYALAEAGLLVKTDANGIMECTRTYSDNIISVIETEDWGYALAGFTGSEQIGYDFQLVKILLKKDLVDNTLPTLSGPADLTYEEGTMGHLLNWTVGDRHPGTYELYSGLNGTTEQVVEFGSWTNGTITWNVDGLKAGIYNITLVVHDLYHNSATNTVWVTITGADTTPPLMSAPTNIKYEEGIYSISWMVRDRHPGDYELYTNSILVDSGSWTNGTITWSAKELAPGSYNVTLIVWDVAENQASDTFLVDIMTPTEKTSINSPPRFIPGLTGIPILVALVTLRKWRKRK